MLQHVHNLMGKIHCPDEGKGTVICSACRIPPQFIPLILLQISYQDDILV